MTEGEQANEGLSSLSIYNIGALDPAIAHRSDQLHFKQNSVQRPATAKTDAKTGRLVPGKRIRPASAKRSPQKETSCYNSLALAGVSTCQPFYYDSSPAGYCQQDNKFSTSQSSQHLHGSPTQGIESLADSQLPDVDGLRVPFSTPVPEPILTDKTQCAYSHRYDSEEDTRYIPQVEEWDETLDRHELNLALPTADESVDEEEEIETIRLLGDLNIDLSGGTATVSIAPQLKAKLTFSAAAGSSYQEERDDDVVEGDMSVIGSPCNSDVKRNMEREIESLLSLNHMTRTVPETEQKSSRQAECWAPDLSFTPHRNDSVESSTDSDEELTGSHSADTDSVNQVTECLAQGSQVGTLCHSPQMSCVEDDHLGHTPNIPEVCSSPLQSVEDGADKRALGRMNVKDEEINGLLYRWNINIDKSKQKDTVEIPLIDGRRDYDEIDEEINRRVEEIERQLADTIAESQCTIEKLESDISNTEFIIPAFREVSNRPVNSQAESADGRPTPTGFSLKRADVNIVQQASKLGLKSRDVSQVFRAVTPRHKKKQAFAGEGRVNLSNVSSRINSGLKKKTGSSKRVSKEKKLPPDGSATDELVIAGNTPIATKPEDSPLKLDKSKQLNQKSVSFRMPTKTCETVPTTKTIKTLTFSGGVDEEESESTAHRLQPRSPLTHYQLPADVKAHLSKCIKKSSSTLKPANQKPPQAPQPTSHKSSPTTQSSNLVLEGNPSKGKEQRVKTRVRSAPPNRKLSRERSANRRIRNETSITGTEELEQEESVSYSEHGSLLVSSHATEHGNKLYKPAHREQVLTAMDMIGDEHPGSPSNYDEEVEGGLSGVRQLPRPCSAHISSKASQGVARRVRSAPVKRRPPLRPAPVSITSHRCIEREDPDEIEQLTQVHDKVAQLGVELDKSVLDRALLPPAKQSVNSCQREMRRHFHTAGLLSSPEKWLEEEYRSVKKAKQKLTRYEQDRSAKVVAC